MNITLRESQPNRWRLRVETKDEFGRRKFQYETVRGDKATALARRDAIARGAIMKAAATPDRVEDHVKKWIEDRLAYGHISASSAELYHRQLRPLYSLLGHKRLDDVTRRDVEGAYRVLVHKFGPKRVRDINVQFAKAMREAAKDGTITADPCDGVIPPKQPRSVKSATFTPDQISQLVEASRAEGQIGLMVRFAIATGCRRGEICALRWADVDLDKGVVQIRQTATVVGFRTVVGPTKTESSARAVALPESMVHELRKHKQAATCDVVFPNSVGSVQDPNRVSNLVRDFFDGLGFKDFSMHDLRHAHATFLLQQKLPLKAVSRRLGHADVRITLGIYAHVMPGDDEQLAGAINAVL